MRVLLVTLFFMVLIFSPKVILAKNKDSSRVQKINFDGSDVDGKVRQPDGSYIVQKRGVEFIPLYKLKERFDDRVEESVEYLK